MDERPPRRRIPSARVRLLAATRWVDRGFRAFERLREEAVLGLVGDELLQSYCEHIYGVRDKYRADRTPQGELLEWEAELIARFVPPAPARVLVGGAGGGREALALAAAGHEVVAFDPAEPLAWSMGHVAGERGLPLTAYVGRYQDLWSPRGAAERVPALPLATALGRFDAFLLGWGSLSHVLGVAERRRLFEVGHALLRRDGCLITSFGHDEVPSATGAGLRARLRAALSARRAAQGRAPRDRFLADIGVLHMFARGEIEALAADAGLEVAYARYTHGFPHAVFVSRPDPATPAETDPPRR